MQSSKQILIYQIIDKFVEDPDIKFIIRSVLQGLTPEQK